MAKGASKLHASPLVSLCKERKEFIKAAKYCRYDFVTSFVVYLESLLELGNALNHYVEHELVICGDYPRLSLSDIDQSEEEDSFLESTSSGYEDEESIGLHDTPAGHEDCCTCGQHSDSYVDMNSMRNRGSFAVPSNITHRHSNQGNAHVHMAMSSEDAGHHEDSQRVPFGNKLETPKSGHWFPQHMNEGPFGQPMYFTHHNDRFVQNGTQAFTMHVEEPHKHGTEQNNPANTLPATPPPPPPPQVPTWDFLYPFGMSYDAPFDHDHDVSELREREGIPDLEEESEADQSSTMSVFDEKEMESGVRHDGSVDGTSNVTQLNSHEDALSTIGRGHAICEIEPKIGEDLGSEAEETTVQSSECPGTSSVTTPVSNCKIGLKQAVLEIKNEFKYLFDWGEEFSSVMEVGKLPYHPKSKKLSAFASCVLRPIFPSVKRSLILSYMLYKPSRAKVLSYAAMRNNQEHVHALLSGLSSTLEELYVWEKKLYGEVMVEEKLRIHYDMQYKKLKDLDDKGSEFDKIDDTLASIKLLRSEINVAVASISVISRRIDGLRDNKLLPELNKLIEGLLGLWKVMNDCHQKQFQAIFKAKSHVHMLDPGRRKKSSLKATLRLERVTLNWGMCFSNFINIQKALVKHLHDWLMKHILLEEREKPENGVDPLSLSDIGAPPIFKVCNDWYNEMHKISETGVSKAISIFASNLYQLYEKQNEEQLLKVKVQHLLRDYKHRLKYFCKKNDIKSHHCSAFFKMKTSEDFMEAEVPLLRASDEKLATSRERLVEEKKRHQQVITHVNDLASSCFQQGLSPIFEALGIFCSENLKIYEQLRLSNARPNE